MIRSLATDSESEMPNVPKIRTSESAPSNRISVTGIAVLALFGTRIHLVTASHGSTRPADERPYEVAGSWSRSWCPFNVHYIQQMETYAKADERCRRAGGSLPQRRPDHMMCLARFFTNTEQHDLAAYFSGGEKGSLRKHLDEIERIWFMNDDKHKQHGKRISSEDKRQVVCTIPVPAQSGGCNFSAIVHYDLLSFVDAQSRCASNNSRLPFREAKDEVQCFKDHFPDISLTWFEGRRPDLFETRSSDRCSLNNPSLKEPCPNELRFVCIPNGWKPDPNEPQFPFAHVAATVTDSETTRFASIYAEHGRTSQFDPYVEDEQQPVNVNPVTVKGPDGDSLIVPVRGSAQHAVDICFNRTGPRLKLLDVGHSKDFYLRMVGTLPPYLIRSLSTDRQEQEFILWAMPRSTKNLSSCPVVIINVDRREVKKTASHCRNEFTILCETRACPYIREDYSELTIPWRRTPAGKKSFQSCSSIRADYTGSITRICSPQGYWEPSQNVSCKPSPRVDGFKHRIFSLKNFDRQSEFIRNELTKHDDALEIMFSTREEVAKNLTDLIRGPEEAENKTKKFMQEVMQTAVGLVNSKKDFSQACQIGREFLMRFGEKLEGNQTVSSDDDGPAPTSNNLAFAVSKVSFAVDTAPPSGNFGIAAVPRELRSEVAGSLVEVSGELDVSHPGVVMGHIVMDKLPVDAVAPNASERFPARTVVNTPVVEFFIAEGSSQKPLNLTGSRVRIFFKPNRPKKIRDEIKCVFYDTENLVYSDYGCEYESEQSNSELTVCVCNHTTSFAALLLPSDIRLSHFQLKFLEYMTLVGMPLSMFSLIVCIFIFTFIRQQHEQRNTIHRNLCISLLAGNILLLVASYGANESQNCTLPGALVHLAFLASLCWMALEGVHIIHFMVIVFVKSNIPTSLYYALGYLLPLAIVSATYWSFDEPYDRTARLCFLTRDNFAILTFIIPLVAVVCVNLLAISVVFYRMRTVKSARDEDLVRSARKWARGVAVLVPLLGLPWLIGLFMYSEDPYVVVGAAIVFNVFLVLQGPGIFLCQVWFNPKKRDSIARYLGNKGRLAELIARVFARSKETQDSSSKSSKVLSKSSHSVRAAHPDAGTFEPRRTCSKNKPTAPPKLNN